MLLFATTLSSGLAPVTCTFAMAVHVLMKILRTTCAQLFQRSVTRFLSGWSSGSPVCTDTRCAAFNL